MPTEEEGVRNGFGTCWMSQGLLRNVSERAVLMRGTESDNLKVGVAWQRIQKPSKKRRSESFKSWISDRGIVPASDSGRTLWNSFFKRLARSNGGRRG